LSGRCTSRRASEATVAGLLAAAAGAQVIWSIWERAHTDADDGDDPGPGLPRADIKDLQTRSVE